eukprot:3194726-Rhodomonas_salina.2
MPRGRILQVSGYSQVRGEVEHRKGHTSQRTGSDGLVRAAHHDAGSGLSGEQFNASRFMKPFPSLSPDGPTVRSIPWLRFQVVRRDRD